METTWPFQGNLKTWLSCTPDKEIPVILPRLRAINPSANHIEYNLIFFMFIRFPVILLVKTIDSYRHELCTGFFT